MSEDDTDSDMDPEGMLEAFRRSKEMQKQERKNRPGVSPASFPGDTHTPDPPLTLP